MTTKEELHRTVDKLDEEHAREVLDYARWVLQEHETLTEEELARVRAGEAEIAHGECVNLDDLRRRIRG